MTISKLIDSDKFELLSEGHDVQREINKVYTCDLLSIAIGKMPADAAWVTVMGNVNTLAVASLGDAACIVLAEGVALDELAVEKAKEQGVAVFKTDLPVFDAALYIHQEIIHQEAGN